MIQFAALPATNQLATGPAITGENGAEQPEIGGFAGLLALQQGAPAPAAPVSAANLALQQLAAILPPAGKTLPGPAMTTAAQTVGAATADADTDANAASLAKAATAKPGPAPLAAVRMIILPSPGGTAAARKSARGAAEEMPEPGSPPAAPGLAIAPGLLPAALPPAQELSYPSAGAHSAVARAAPATLPVPALVDTRPPGRALAAASPAAAQAGDASGPDQIRLLPVAALRPDSAPAAAFTLPSPAAPQAATALRLRPVIGVGAAEPASGKFAAEMLAASDQLTTTALSGPVNPDAAGRLVPATAAPTAPAPAHDFATLVDRLITARDAAQTGSGPQAVNVAINHAEFGEISLRFRHDDTGLTVSVASPHPDFARAAQAAAPTANASGSNDSGNGNAPQSGQHAAGSNLGQANGQAGGQAGGQSGGQAHLRGEARATPRPAGANQDTPAAEIPTHRRGRFA